MNKFAFPASVRHDEKIWHENHFASRSDREMVVPQAIRDRYLNPPLRPLFPHEELFRLTGDLRDKSVLVFGCGDENTTVILALKGAEVWAFDLSEEAISIQRRMAEANGVSQRLHTIVSAAEDISYGETQFDIIIGSAILHHIPNYLPFLPEKLYGLLRKDGLALFVEPMIRSKSLQFILARMPGHGPVSPGERQLLDRDFDHFRDKFDVSFSYFCFLSRLDRFVLRGPLETAPRLIRSLVYSLYAVDYLMLRTLGMKRLAGTAVISLRPKTRY